MENGNYVKGNIFDIQRFCVHDGPGIRTTVFFKGCPLNCMWCHNPEGKLFEQDIRFLKDKCIGCSMCKGNRDVAIAAACPAKALICNSKNVNVDEIINVVMKDKAYYGKNGGLTCSGGECLAQPEFLNKLLTAAVKEGLNTVVDTSGYAPFEVLESVMPVVSLFLYDIKCIEEDVHVKYTGVSNEIILKNFEKLVAKGMQVQVRVPVLPGVNASIKQMGKIAKYISNINSNMQVKLLPYSSIGAAKYNQLGIEYEYSAGRKIQKEELNNYLNIFEQHGINAK